MNLTLEQIGIVAGLLAMIAGGTWALITRAEGRADKRAERLMQERLHAEEERARAEAEKIELARKLTEIQGQLGHLKERDQEHAAQIGQLQQDVGTLVRELLMTKI